jgi:hypothetical protein
MNAFRHIDQQGFSAELIELPAARRGCDEQAECQSSRCKQGMSHKFQ